MSDASTPSAVMHRHLKETLVPPDHLNTALSVGISEVVEVMMAKKKTDRYNSITELLGDLRAVRNGEPPMQAHQHFDSNVLADLEKGHITDGEYELDSEHQAAPMGLIMSVVVLLGLLIIAIIVIVMMASGNK